METAARVSDRTGKCECGCGEDTPIAKRTNRARQAIKGQPQRFCFQHGSRARIEPVPLNELEVAWAAGFFDGEGSAHVGPRGGLRLSLSQTDTEVLERFSAAVGGIRNISGPYFRTNADGGRWQPVWHWRVYGVRAEFVANVLDPYLSTRKRTQIADVRERGALERAA